MDILGMLSKSSKKDDEAKRMRKIMEVHTSKPQESIDFLTCINELANSESEFKKFIDDMLLRTYSYKLGGEHVSFEMLFDGKSDKPHAVQATIRTPND